ncbi:hypothetical protein OAN47_02750 [Planctomycetota bacterium]|nr:hypothetical protein [Planctomycetota bacterium]
MIGVIQVLFPSNGSGRILGEDGQHYDFEKSDYSEISAIYKGLEVNFEPLNSFAKGITVLQNLESKTPVTTKTSAGIPTSTTETENFIYRLPGSGKWLWIYLGAYILQVLLITQTVSFDWRNPIYAHLIRILLFYYCYRCTKFTWDQLRSQGGSISTNGIIARILIPIYNLYGIPNLFYRWAKEFNTINQNSNLRMPLMPVGFSVLTGITTVLFLLTFNETSWNLLISFYNQEPELGAIATLVAMLLGLSHIVTLAVYGHMSIRRAIAIKEL